MKKYILLFIIIALPVFSFAQDGATALLPDEGETGDYVSWDRADNVKAIKWEEKAFNEFNNLYGKSGYLYSNENNSFGFYLSGKEDGYSIIEAAENINGDPNNRGNWGGRGSHDIGLAIEIEELFQNREYTFKEIEVTGSSGLYEVKFPNKKRVWLQTRSQSGSGYDEYYLNIYLNENDIDRERF